MTRRVFIMAARRVGLLERLRVMEERWGRMVVAWNEQARRPGQLWGPLAEEWPAFMDAIRSADDAMRDWILRGRM